ncbi:ATP-binding protein [Frigoribacterium sp. VKM Ac-1396]|uniref:ATP-binding protein n=1 Tax=Frigoribacterium sp. VKM Ac-1396 TaxID=2783821 RepID=UPI00188D97AA|nr:ATP-binding protein [Frigoribacterium sp. VKM Ac-1396]
MSDAQTRTIEFSFSWIALKLLGKGLYSNPWSALSELVANGLDAGAANVYVYVDARNKASATIEILDDGSGMDMSDLKTYTTVGYDKRAASNSSSLNDRPMGRKGIGKLAALYLSPLFYIRTRRGQSDTTWSLDVREGKVDNDDNPALEQSGTQPSSPNTDLYDTFSSGTFLSLQDVDLRGHGTQALNSLSQRLANQFSMGALPEQTSIYLAIKRGRATPTYKRVQKAIAYKNMAFVATRGVESYGSHAPNGQLGKKLQIPAPVNGGQYVVKPKISSFALEPDTGIPGWDRVAKNVDLSDSTYRSIPFELSGWVGIHATIDNESAQINDKRFTKNRFYNPAQLRLYVRGKLASDRLLEQLGLTGTYLNYIEGELSFDLLDEDNLPDIATSNRQDFDETDDRITLLRALVRPLVRSLISMRQDLAATISALSRQEKADKESAGKQAFSQMFDDELSKYNLSEQERANLHTTTTNKIKGDVVAKDSFQVFISHSSADERFASFIFEFLKDIGATSDEVFYTSKEGEVDQYVNKSQLAKTVKQAIVNRNTMMLYLTSHNFLKSEYCMFEGGAGWATRAVDELTKLNLDFHAIPKFLHEDESELSLFSNKKIELRLDVHNYLIAGIFNPIIEHLNRGRTIAGLSQISLLSAPVIPAKHVRKDQGKEEADYFHEGIAKFWDVYVNDDLDTYLGAYPWPKDSAR